MRVFAALVCVALLCPRAASAEDRLPWWVADADAATNLGWALATLWPDNPVALRVGAPEPGLDGVHHDGVDLVLVLDGAERRLAPGAEPDVQVVLVRSWLRGRRKAPVDPPAQPVETAPEPEPVGEPPGERPAEEVEAAVAAPAPRPRERPEPFLAAWVGAGGPIQKGDAQPGFGARPTLNLAGRFGVGGRLWGVGGVVGLRLGDQAHAPSGDFDGAALFVAASASFRGPLPPGGGIEIAVAGGLRVLRWSARAEPEDAAAGPAPGIDAALRGWSPDLPGGVALGGGARVETTPRTVVIDTAEDGPLRLAVVSAVVEFGVRWGSSSSFSEGSTGR